MTKTSTKVFGLIAGIAAIGGIAAIAPAQGNSAVSQAIAQGIVGETASGYLGFAQTPSAELRQQVDEINISRRSAYADLAQSRGVTRQQVASETACRLFGGLDTGRAYQLADGVWRTKGSAPVSC